MLTKQNKQHIILKEDLETLVNYLQKNKPELKYDQMQAEKLTSKLQEVEVLPKNDFPLDVVRLHSKVTLRDTIGRINYEYTVVLPHEANQKDNSISVLAPVGKRMLGARKGDTITIDASARKKHFLICEVSQPV